MMRLNRKAVKVAMAERDLNQKQLAILAGMHAYTISRLLTGKDGGTPATWSKIAKALKVSELDIVKTD